MCKEAPVQSVVENKECLLSRKRYVTYFSTMDGEDHNIVIPAFIDDEDMLTYLLKHDPEMVAYTYGDLDEMVMKERGGDSILRNFHTGLTVFPGGVIEYPTEEELGRPVLYGDARVRARDGQVYEFDITGYKVMPLPEKQEPS